MAFSVTNRAAGSPARGAARVWRRPHGLALVGLVIAALVATPVLVVFAAVFTPAGEVWAHLVDTVLAEYIANTLWLMLGVGIGTLVIGVGTAWLSALCRFPGRAVFQWALLLPLAAPAYAVAFTYAGLLDYAGPVQTALRDAFGWSRGDYWFPEISSLGGVIAVMSLVLYPYVYLLARAAFLDQSVCVLEVSRTLGRGPWQSFTRIALPLARPSIVAGLSLALMEAVSDFGTVAFYGVPTFTTGIFSTWFGLGDHRAAAQLASVLMIFVLVLIVAERRSRGRAKFFHTSRRYRALPGIRLRGGPAALAFLACFLPVLLGFLLPGAVLLQWSLETGAEMIDGRFLSLVWNSVSLAGAAAVLAVGLALLVAYGMRLAPGPVMTIAARIAGLGYAVPGTVIAVGIIIPLAWIDNSVDAWMRARFDISTGLLMSGTLVALMFAYLVRFLAVSLATVEASLGKVTPGMDDASRALGAGAGRTLFNIHMPMISGGMLTAAILVFVDVMKELPATMILRPFNFNTLAIRAFELASDERLEDAASAALAIVAAGLVPVILLSLAVARSRPGYERRAEAS